MQQMIHQRNLLVFNMLLFDIVFKPVGTVVKLTPWGSS